MKKGLLLLGVLVVAAGAVFYFYVAPKLQHKAAQEEHRQNVERELAPLAAMLKAPDGATPCETSFNAFAAYDAAARAQGSSRPWVELPDRPTFLKRCGGLSQQEQLCLQPRYQSAHHADCDSLIARIQKGNVLYEQVGKAPASGLEEPPPR